MRGPAPAELESGCPRTVNSGTLELWNLGTLQHGTFDLTIGGKPIQATAGMVVRLPAHVPHAVAAAGQARMLLIMLKADAPR